MLFGDHGASAHAEADTLEAFVLAGRLGAGGVRAVVRASAEGVAVVADGESHGGRFRRRAVADTPADELPEAMVPLAAVIDACAPTCRFLMEIADVAAVPDLLDLAARPDVESRLWLAHQDLDVLSGLRQENDTVRLVNVAKLGDLPAGPERLAAQLRELQIDAVQMSHLDWNAGMVALFHRFRRLTIGSDAQYERVLEMLIAAGIDGVVGEHVDRMVDVASQFGSLEGA